jgi:hypothetical protein
MRDLLVERVAAAHAVAAVMLHTARMIEILQTPPPVQPRKDKDAFIRQKNPPLLHAVTASMVQYTHGVQTRNLAKPVGSIMRTV